MPGHETIILKIYLIYNRYILDICHIFKHANIFSLSFASLAISINFFGKVI